MDELKSIIGKVATGASLSREEAASAFDSMMSGEATPSQMGGLLMALRVRGETVDEITGAVLAMRAKMLRVDAPAVPDHRALALVVRWLHQAAPPSRSFGLSSSTISARSLTAAQPR